MVKEICCCLAEAHRQVNASRDHGVVTGSAKSRTWALVLVIRKSFRRQHFEIWYAATHTVTRKLRQQARVDTFDTRKELIARTESIVGIDSLVEILGVRREGNALAATKATDKTQQNPASTVAPSFEDFLFSYYQLLDSNNREYMYIS